MCTYASLLSERCLVGLSATGYIASMKSMNKFTSCSSVLAWLRAAFPNLTRVMSQYIAAIWNETNVSVRTWGARVASLFNSWLSSNRRWHSPLKVHQPTPCLPHLEPVRNAHAKTNIRTSSPISMCAIFISINIAYFYSFCKQLKKLLPPR